jgi:hypothetical protein
MVRQPRPSGMTVQALLPAAMRLGRRWGPREGATKWADKRAFSGWYWSSTQNADNPNNAWNVNFNDGNVNNDDKDDNNNYVRAVRRGT